ncbi:beta-Ala-His dipeptidase isoform X1 [Artibeus jamaicensis]|uniref:beta-Ala-His dipeptidase isoform X1 n=1 Tax=Artibeus jamaicensis TaxID=9417 RepID=UPI00235AC917|nr:beta-Ala-His dipeptidase isoform X1 [Artibeus jamaicensis]
MTQPLIEWLPVTATQSHRATLNPGARCRLGQRGASPRGFPAVPGPVQLPPPVLAEVLRVSAARVSWCPSESRVTGGQKVKRALQGPRGRNRTPSVVVLRFPEELKAAFIGKKGKKEGPVFALQLSGGQTLPIPPVVLAELGKEPEKPTVCFYGHLDVQPAAQADGWLTAPFVLTEVDGKLYGRGATDNKGPVLAWINAVSTFRALEEDLPVNVKFVLEGMEEAGSVALEELVKREKDGFFSNVDCIVISDNLWLSQRPALIYGMRGNSYFTVEVKCRDQDFHSGTFGGILSEPMADLVALLGSLTNASGRILVPGIYDQVAPVTEEERQLYSATDLDLAEFRHSTQVKKFLFDTKEEVLMHLWRYPSLSIHGIEGAFAGPGTKTVIPGQVTGKFSIRLVPHMEAPVVETQVKQYLQRIFSERNSSNQMAVSMVLGLRPWIADMKDSHYLAAKRAIKTGGTT